RWAGRARPDSLRDRVQWTRSPFEQRPNRLPVTVLLAPLLARLAASFLRLVMCLFQVLHALGVILPPLSKVLLTLLPPVFGVSIFRVRLRFQLPALLHLCGRLGHVLLGAGHIALAGLFPGFAEVLSRVASLLAGLLAILLRLHRFLMSLLEIAHRLLALL